ncbi:MAG: class I SAM-dependent methyltransferase [Alphaproteobacteria bacterium]|nr:class I SAM-dependent methyltransferase [Alphaproteobacteria bacterium]
MNLIAAAIGVVERTPLPDPVTRLGIDLLVGRSRRLRAATPPSEEQAFAAAMAAYPIAEHADAANRQHYEVPVEFFSLMLGPRRKYSCCLYDDAHTTLDQAEMHALEDTVAHAGIADGQRVLELGCGWGSLTLFMAECYRGAAITAVSNSRGQREFIKAEATRRGLHNVTVVTADMNAFEPTARFDRVVSVEMFEHMANWQTLLGRVRSWLEPDGRLLLHVFAHRTQPYRFDHRDPTDWIARYFFTGGIMPSHGLIRQFDDLFAVEQEWRWNGRHYQRTARDWLANFDACRSEIDRILAATYGAEAAVWGRRWRLFLLATAGLFGHGGGEEWGVSHYRLRPVGSA